VQEDFGGTLRGQCESRGCDRQGRGYGVLRHAANGVSSTGARMGKLFISYLLSCYSFCPAFDFFSSKLLIRISFKLSF
jgi:hypothetical protein